MKLKETNHFVFLLDHDSLSSLNSTWNFSSHLCGNSRRTITRLLQLLLRNLVDQYSLGVLAFQVSCCLLDTCNSVFLLTTQILQISKVQCVNHLLLLFLLLVKIIVVLWHCHLFICVALLTIITLLFVNYLNLRFGWCSTLSSCGANFNRSSQFVLFSGISLVRNLFSAKLRLVILLLRLLFLSVTLVRFDVISTDWVRPICPVKQNLLLMLVDWQGIIVFSTWLRVAVRILLLL